jgi:predicted O-methyltransferase YrrM
MNEQIEMNFKKFRFHGGSTAENFTSGLYDLIKKYLNEETVMVEVGSFAGVSSELFALNVKHIICVDPYQPYPEIQFSAICDAENSFADMMRGYNNISKVKMTSKNASSIIADDSLDFVYIDGAHDYENVLNDLKCWFPKIKKGGYIGGHDFNMPGVNSAINDFGIKIIEDFSEYSWIAKI